MRHAWLKEFFAQWKNARGKLIKPRTRPFRRKWEDLLDSAGLHSAEDQKVARHEAERLVQPLGEGRHAQLCGVGLGRVVDLVDLPLAAADQQRAVGGGVPGRRPDRPAGAAPVWVPDGGASMYRATSGSGSRGLPALGSANSGISELRRGVGDARARTR